MDLLKSWAVAVAVYVVGSLLSAGTAIQVGDDLLNGTIPSVTWAAGSSLLVYLLMAMIAALVHPAPRRDDPVRHAVAALGIPAVTVVGGVVFGVVQGFAASGNATSAITAVAGALVGWALVTRLRARQRTRAGAY